MIDLPANPVDGQEVTFADRTWKWTANVGGAGVGAWDMKPVSQGDANLAAEAASDAYASEQAAAASAAAAAARWVAVPATAVSAGTYGQQAADAGFLYTCVAPNVWRRVAHAAW